MCLLDSRSQRSYFSSDILESLKCNHFAGTGDEYAISMYLSIDSRIGSRCHQTPLAADYKMVIPKMVSCPMVNFVLEPRHSYADPCRNSFKESSVE